MADRFAVVFDFDRTLFDTKAYNNMRESVFCNLGIPAEVYLDTYNRTRLPIYNVTEHARLMAEYEKNIVKRDPRPAIALTHIYCRLMYSLLDKIPEAYVFPDVLPMLKAILSRNDMDMYILSHGNWIYQYKKIKGSGINKLFDNRNVIITEGEKGPYFPYLMENYSEILYYDDFRPHFLSAAFYLNRAGIDPARTKFINVMRHTNCGRQFNHGTGDDIYGVVNSILPSDLDILGTDNAKT